LAELLLNHSVLFIHNRRFKITELEFYVNDFKHHSDTFASSHKITTEKTKGQWIVNPAGLEITIGEAFKGESLTCGTIKVCSLMELAMKNEKGTTNTPGLDLNCARKIVKYLLEAGDKIKLPNLLKLINTNDVFCRTSPVHIADVTSQPDLI